MILITISVAAQELDDPGILPDSPLYTVDKTLDDLRISLANEENKASVAIGVHNERIAEAKYLADKGDDPRFVKTIQEAHDKIKFAQREITPEASEEIADSSKKSLEVLTDLKERLPDESNIENAIDQQIVETKKAEIVAEITTKIDQLCNKLVELVGLEEAIAQEPRCDPDYKNSPKWLRRKVENEYKDFDQRAKQKFFTEMENCFNDPRQCRCEEIPIKSFSNTCFKIIPNVIKCEYEQDEEACQRAEEIGRNKDEMFEGLPDDVRGELEDFFVVKEKEAFEKHAPKECVQAGARTKDECMKIMMNKYMPQECKEAGATTRQQCEKIMMEKHGSFGSMPSECQIDGKFIGPDECMKIMMEKFLPKECKEAQAFTRESCEAIMISKHAPKECIQNGNFIGRERCEELMGSRSFEGPGFGQGPPDIEQAISSCMQQGRSREECESFIRSSFPQPGQFERPPEFQKGQPGFQYGPEVEGVSDTFDRIESNTQNIPHECQGLTQQECSERTGHTFGPEIPSGVVFREGHAEPLSSTDIHQVIQNAETYHEEINIDEVRESIIGEVTTLESGTQVLEETPHEEASSAIQETSSTPTESSPPPESAPSEVTGSIVFDVISLINKLSK